MLAVYVILGVLGIAMFFSLFVFLSFFIYSFCSEKRNDAKERDCAPYHEAGHVILAMVTGMGFEKVSIEGNSHNFGFMSHRKDQYCRNRSGEPEMIREITQREIFENSLMASLAGYVAEMIACGKNSMPSSAIQYGDMGVVNEIIDAMPFLYMDLDLSIESYLETILAKTRTVLMNEAEAHYLISENLKEKGSLTEKEVWNIMDNYGLCQHIHNPYGLEEFSVALPS